VSGSWRTKLFLWQAEKGSRRTRRRPRDDPRAEVGEDVRVGVGIRVGVVECQLYYTAVGLHVLLLVRPSKRPVFTDTVEWIGARKYGMAAFIMHCAAVTTLA